MTEKSAVERGWEFSSSIMGTNVATNLGSEYVNAVDNSINKLTKAINDEAAKHGAMGIDQLQGFMAEQWAAETYNINATAAGLDVKKNFAEVLVSERNEKNSVDIRLHTEKGIIDYGSKSYKNAERSVKAQAEFDHTTNRGRYDGQMKLIPTDQKDEGITIAERLYNKNKDERPDVAASYKETKKTLTDRVDDNNGVTSEPSTRKHNDEIAKEAQKGEFKAEEHGIDAASSIKTDYIVKQALKSGYTAAIITAVTQIAPEIYKALDYLIKNGELRLEDILRIGEKGISGTAEGFLRGSVSSSLCIVCKSGMLGEAFKVVSPEVLGTMVTLTMQTIKNSILVAAGRMTPQQMGTAFADSIIVSSGFLLGAKIGSGIGSKIIASKIGGAIGQALGLTAPVIGYLIGSLVGTAFSVVYNIGKKKFISFCVDTGFTCFGLVEQDYQLPEEFLNKMGINTIKLNRTPIHQTNISTARISQTTVNRQNYETIGFTMPRRGLIGVNKVGYVV